MFEYIQEMREILYNLQSRIQKAKQNIEGISQAMKVSPLPPAHRGPGDDSRRDACLGSTVPEAAEPLPSEAWDLMPMSAPGPPAGSVFFCPVGLSKWVFRGPSCQAGGRNKGREGVWSLRPA